MSIYDDKNFPPENPFDGHKKIREDKNLRKEILYQNLQIHTFMNTTALLLSSNGSTVQSRSLNKENFTDALVHGRPFYETSELEDSMKFINSVNPEDTKLLLNKRYQECCASKTEFVNKYTSFLTKS